MIGIKIFGASIILAGCCYAGFSSATAINKEINSLRVLLSSLDFMSCELQYKLTPLPDLCKQTAEETKGNLSGVFMHLSEELDNQISPDVKSCMRAAISKTKALPDATKKCLLQLGGSLGRFDLNGQINGIESVRDSCKRRLSALETDKDSRIKIFKTLGICAGAAIVILFA